MDDALARLYHEVILAHDRAPRNEGTLEAATHRARVSNPLCGDRVQIDLRVKEERITEARFVGRGCAIARASASLLTTLTQGCPTDRAATYRARLEAWLGGRGDLPEALSALLVFDGVRAFPSRARCASLAWEALEQALGRP